MWLSCSCLSTADEKSMVHLDVFELEITQREENRRAAQKPMTEQTKKKKSFPIIERHSSTCVAFHDPLTGAKGTKKNQIEWQIEWRHGHASLKIEEPSIDMWWQGGR